MNVKKVIKSQKIRHRILRSLYWVPDRFMVSLQYLLILKRWPNLCNPSRFTEWLQCYKINYRNETMLQCVDKYSVRDFVRSRIGEGYLNRMYQLCDKPEDIDFNRLPDKFVIKTTDGGNGDNVLFITDKSNLDVKDCIHTLNSWKGKRYDRISREWAYSGMKHSRVIIEELLEDPSSADGSIDDYKFLCFNGKFKYLWVDKNRFSEHRRGFWDHSLNFMDDAISDCPTFNSAPDLPTNIGKMIDIAEKLAQGFPFIRVDLYNIKGKILFGELTFYPWSGYVQYSPDSFDYKLGEEFSDWRQQHL